MRITLLLAFKLEECVYLCGHYLKMMKQNMKNTNEKKIKRPKPK